jgi:hypothetical protein
MRAPAYFSCMSFSTDFTPLTALAILTADLMSWRELTKPLSWTTPLNVSTFDLGNLQARLTQDGRLDLGGDGPAVSYFGVCPTAHIAAQRPHYLICNVR